MCPSFVRAAPDKAEFCCDINLILTPRNQTIAFLITGSDVSGVGWIYNSIFGVGFFLWDLKGLGVGGFYKIQIFITEQILCAWYCRWRWSRT